MAINSAYAAYRNAAVQTSSDTLLIMLYDGLIQSLEHAKQSISSNDISGAHQSLTKAQEIIVEGLQEPLNMQFDVSKSLASLYDYFVRRLIEANVKKDIGPIDEVLGYVRDFRETWTEAARKSKSEQAGESFESSIGAAK